MSRVGRKNHSSFLVILLLFAIFAIGIFGVLLHGGEFYRSILDNQEERFQENTPMQYLQTKVRQSDWSEGIGVQIFDGAKALVLKEKIDGTVYETYIYCYNGYLCELYAEEGFAQKRSDGEALFVLADFDAVIMDNTGMLRLMLLNEENQWQETEMFLHSGGVVG